MASQVRAVMVDNCGHYLAEEQPERVVEELLRFFAESYPLKQKIRFPGEK